jgi:prevent-host-death family protein
MMATTPARGSAARAATRRVSVSATEAKNRFRDVLDLAAQGKTVVITTYDKPAAVVVSPERYRELTGEPDVDLAELTREFDGLVERMQGPEAAAGFDALFEMDSAALGDAAVRGVRRDGE